MNDYLSQLNHYYDKIYVLTVEAAHSRREAFAKRFDGLDYSFFQGADKKDFTIDELVSKNIFSDPLTRKHHRFNKTMRTGEIACSWSHRMMYEDMLQHNYERVLIFEDDAIADENVFSKIPEILNEMPADWELLMWGWSKNGINSFGTELKKLLYHTQHLIGTLKWHHTIIKNLYAKRLSTHIKRAGFHDYTSSYAITKKAAEKLVAMQTPIQFIADNLLAHASAAQIVKSYITWPAIFVQEGTGNGSAAESYIR